MKKSKGNYKENTLNKGAKLELYKNVAKHYIQEYEKKGKRLNIDELNKYKSLAVYFRRKGIRKCSDIYNVIAAYEYEVSKMDKITLNKLRKIADEIYDNYLLVKVISKEEINGKISNHAYEILENNIINKICSLGKEKIVKEERRKLQKIREYYKEKKYNPLLSQDEIQKILESEKNEIQNIKMLYSEKRKEQFKVIVDKEIEEKIDLLRIIKGINVN